MVHLVAEPEIIDTPLQQWEGAEDRALPDIHIFTSSKQPWVQLPADASFYLKVAICSSDRRLMSGTTASRAG